MADSHLLVEDYAGVTLVKFQDSSLLETNVIDRIGRELYALADEHDKPKLVLDFSNVKFLASHTLGVLLTLRKKSLAVSGSLVLCGLRKDLMQVFLITNLDKVFEFFDDDTAALGHFRVHVK